MHKHASLEIVAGDGNRLFLRMYPFAAFEIM
jgi:hypothetical protein